MNTQLRNQLIGSLALTFESPKEARAREARMRARLLADYQQARNEWWTLRWHDRNRWSRLDQDGQDAMEGAFERAVEARNELYGTERPSSRLAGRK